MERLEKDPVLFSLMIDDLDHYELLVRGVVKIQLERKLKIGSRELDMKKFCDHYCLPEMIARKIINSIEINHYHGKQFIINNGSKEWHTQDEIRNAQVQKMAGGENT